MKRWTETAKHQGKTPIFGEDIPCPQCGYNLRGCSGPQCPECGYVFDANGLRNEMRFRGRKVRWLWIVRIMCMHPIKAWSEPIVRLGKNPGLGLTGLCATIGALIPTTLLFVLLLSGPPPTKWAVLVLVLATSTVGEAAIALVMAEVHTLLCRAGSPMPGNVHVWQDVRRVLNYCSVWLGLALAFLVGCLHLLIATVVAWGFAKPSQHEVAMAIAFSVLAIGGWVASCVVWGISLYAGIRSTYPANRNYAIWCGLCNPFWYIAGLLVTVLVRELLK